MMRIGLITMVAAAVTALMLTAPATASNITVMGAGGSTCGMWAAARKEDPKGILVQYLYAWVQGFVTATGLENDRDLFANVGDNEGAMAYIDNYCSANPLIDIGNAASALANELSKTAPMIKSRQK